MFKRSRHELQKSTPNCMAKDMGEQSEDNIAVAWRENICHQSIT